MKSFFSLSIHDLAVMVGAGCFASSALSTLWGFAATSAAPVPLTMIAALAGFAGGRLISSKSEKKYART